GLLRQEGLRAFVPRGAAWRAQAARRARDGALPRPGADRVADARGHDRFPAAAVHALRRGGCARSLSRSEPRPPHGRSGLCQSRGDDGDSPLPAQPLARADRPPAPPPAPLTAPPVTCPPPRPLAFVAPHPALAATLSPLRGARVPRRLAFLRHLPQ